MTVFSVHLKPQAPPEKAVLVAEGFSFSAFLFTVFWALYKGMWIVALALILTFAAIAALTAQFALGDTIASAMQLAAALIFGVVARDLHRSSLRAKGCDEVGNVSGASLDEAELKFFASIPIRQLVPAPVTPLRLRNANDTLGLFGNA